MLRIFALLTLVIGCQSGKVPGRFDAGESKGKQLDASGHLGTSNKVGAQDEERTDQIIVRIPEEDRYEIIAGEPQEVSLAFRSCRSALESQPEAKSGIYKLYYMDESGEFVKIDAYCDMETAGGAWALALNYVHGADTNPPLVVRTDSFPLLGPGVLGDNEQDTKFFGHVSPGLAAEFNFEEIRFSCQSEGNDRMIHIKTSDLGCIAYFKTGEGNCYGVAENFTPLDEHEASLPASQDDRAGSDRGDEAMTGATFRSNAGFRHWSINDDGDWECDDDPDDADNATIHRIWFR